MPDPTEYQEEGRSQEPALGLGYYGHLDPEPPLALTYLAVLAVAAGIGFVAWLGWGWQAILLTVVVVSVVGVLAFQRRRRRRGTFPDRYDEARTKTVEHQSRMHLDSKGPLGF